MPNSNSAKRKKPRQRESRIIHRDIDNIHLSVHPLLSRKIGQVLFKKINLPSFLFQFDMSENQGALKKPIVDIIKKIPVHVIKNTDDTKKDSYYYFSGFSLISIYFQHLNGFGEHFSIKLDLHAEIRAEEIINYAIADLIMHSGSEVFSNDIIEKLLIDSQTAPSSHLPNLKKLIKQQFSEKTYND